MVSKCSNTCLERHSFVMCVCRVDVFQWGGIGIMLMLAFTRPVAWLHLLGRVICSAHIEKRIDMHLHFARRCAVDAVVVGIVVKPR